MSSPIINVLSLMSSPSSSAASFSLAVQVARLKEACNQAVYSPWRQWKAAWEALSAFPHSRSKCITPIHIREALVTKLFKLLPTLSEGSKLFAVRGDVTQYGLLIPLIFDFYSCVVNTIKWLCKLGFCGKISCGGWGLCGKIAVAIWQWVHTFIQKTDGCLAHTPTQIR